MYSCISRVFFVSSLSTDKFIILSSNEILQFIQLKSYWTSWTIYHNNHIISDHWGLHELSSDVVFVTNSKISSKPSEWGTVPKTLLMQLLTYIREQNSWNSISRIFSKKASIYGELVQHFSGLYLTYTPRILSGSNHFISNFYKIVGSHHSKW